MPGLSGLSGLSSIYKRKFDIRRIPGLQAWYSASPAWCYMDGSASLANDGQFLNINNNSSITLTGNDLSFWWAGWVYMTSSGADRGIIMKVGNTTSETFFFQQDLQRLMALTSNTSERVAVQNGIDLALNQWHFFLYWYDPIAQKLRLRINNGSVNEATIFAPPGTTEAQLEFGRRGGTFFKGRLASFAFGKAPLGGIGSVIDSISSSLYNNGAGKVYTNLTETEKSNWGLVSFWDLNKQNNFTDKHGTNHLTNNNSVDWGAGLPRSMCEDGDPVALWMDRSGNARNLTQLTTGKRPVLRKINNKWVVRFTAAGGNFMSMPANVTLGNFMFGWVGNTTVNEVDNVIMGESGGNRTLANIIQGKVYTYSTGYANPAFPTYSFTNRHAGFLTRTGSTISFRHNLTTKTNSVLNDNVTVGLVGGLGMGTANFDGDISEIVLYNTYDANVKISEYLYGLI